MEEGLELELELAEVQPGRFQITVRSPAGEETGELRLDPMSVLGQRSQLQSTVLASAVTSRGALGEVEAPVRQVGELLFRGLFNAGVYGAYKASLALTQQQGLPLRIVLRTQVPELAALPWEMLYDTDAGVYLCQRDPLVRHVAVSAPTRPLEVRPPLRVLGMVSAPRDKQRLDVDGEKHRLTTALTGLGELVQLRWVNGGSWADLQGELVSGSWHVMHFIGHGGFDVSRKEGVLALEDDAGMSDLVGADRFSQLLTTQVPPPQLVVLNSCEGAQAAADDLFSSTAAALVRAGVSASVAMQFAVSDPAAKAFAAGFYQAIAHNHSVADAVRIGRIGIRGTSEDTLEWVTPALYLRGDDAPLFTVLPPPAGSKATDEVPTPEEAARRAGAQALYQQAMSHYRAGRFRDAVALFDSLLSLQPGYRDAQARRTDAAARQQSADAFDGASEAENRGDWAGAVAGYAEALRLQPDHPDARARLENCRRQQVVADLFAELRQHLDAQDWVAAAAVADELNAVDPDAPDPDSLILRAREGSSNQLTSDLAEDAQDVQTHPGEDGVHAEVDVGKHVGAGGGARDPHLQTSPTRTPAPMTARAGSTGDRSPKGSRSGRLYVLLAAVAFGLVAIGVGASRLLTTDSNVNAVPAPFKSAALYSLARNLFDDTQCRVPAPGEAPLAEKLPLTELVKCDNGPYTAVFLCSRPEDFLGNRREFLRKAVGPPKQLEGAPAGESGPIDGVQVSYLHKDSRARRVYWDSRSSSCAGELQTDVKSMAATVRYWRNGMP
jgi:tetratricopeptide (TPR) repeat protein